MEFDDGWGIEFDLEGKLASKMAGEKTFRKVMKYLSLYGRTIHLCTPHYYIAYFRNSAIEVSLRKREGDNPALWILAYSQNKTDATEDIEKIVADNNLEELRNKK